MAEYILIYGLLALSILLQAGDVATTYKVLSQRGYEKAPVAKWFIQTLGILPGLIVLKLIVTIPIVTVTFMGLMPWWVLLAYCLIYVWVVWHNAGQIK